MWRYSLSYLVSMFMLVAVGVSRLLIDRLIDLFHSRSFKMMTDFPNGAIHEVVRKSMDSYGSKVAMVDTISGNRFTFSKVLHDSMNMANSLIKNCNISKGEVVSCLLQNQYDYVPILLGATAAGGVLAPINPTATPTELFRYLQNVQPNVLFLMEDDFWKIYQVLKDYKLPVLKHIVICKGKSSVDASKMVSSIKLWEYEDFVVPAHGTYTYPDIKISPATDLAMLLHSSGTSGPPKAVMITHLNLCFNLNRFATDIEHDDLHAHLFPVAHIGGNVGILSALWRGATTFLIPKFSLSDYVNLIEHEKLTYFVVPPTVLSYLTKHQLSTPRNLSSVKKIRFGSSTIGKELLVNARAAFPRANFKQIYGTTEGGLTHSSTDQLNLVSCGRPIPTVDAKIVDIDTNQSLPANKPGELLVKCPGVTIGYFNNTAATQETIDSDGYLHTGDIGYVDDDGLLYIIDRKKDLIKFKGNQTWSFLTRYIPQNEKKPTVSPAELEDIIMEIPAVQIAAVFGTISKEFPEYGELPTAAIKLKQNQFIDPNYVHQLVNSKVSKYKRLKGGVHFVDDIPVTLSGKILRRRMREMLVSTIASNISKL